MVGWTAVGAPSVRAAESLEVVLIVVPSRYEPSSQAVSTRHIQPRSVAEQEAAFAPPDGTFGELKAGYRLARA